MDHEKNCDGCSDLFHEDELYLVEPEQGMMMCEQCRDEYEQYCAEKAAWERQCDDAREELFNFADRRPRGPTGETAPGA